MKVRLVENAHLWKRYSWTKSEFQGAHCGINALRSPPEIHSVDDATINEYFLWHGCQTRTVEEIAKDGFDERNASLGGLYGTGNYFASDACKAMQYSRADGCFVTKKQCGKKFCECKDSTEVGRSRKEPPWRRDFSRASRSLLYCRVLLGGKALYGMQRFAFEVQQIDYSPAAVRKVLKKKKAMQDARFGDGSGFSVFGGYTGEESDDDQPRSRGKSVDFIQAFQASELAAKHSIQVKFEDIDRIVTAGDRVTLVLSHHQ